MSDLPFSTEILDEHLERQKERCEALRQAKLQEAFQALHALSRRFSFRQAWLFGSVTRPGNFDPQSDLDVAVEGLKSEDFLDALRFLSSALGREVDLIRLEGFRWRDRILQRGIPWKKVK